LTLQATRDSLDTLRLQRRPFAPTLTDLGFNPLSDYEQIAAQEGYYAMFRQRAEENTKVLGRKAASLPRSDPLDPAQLDGLRAALRHAAIGLFVATRRLGILLFGEAVGEWGAIMFATIPATFALSSIGLLDMVFTAFLFGAFG